MLTENQLRRLYKAAADMSPRGQQAVEDALAELAPIVYERCLYWATYEYEGTRRWCSGGTPQMKVTVEAFIAFIIEYEARGSVSLVTFDAVVWACHNNGTMAPEFIQTPWCWPSGEIFSRDDQERWCLQLLNELGGIHR